MHRSGISSRHRLQMLIIISAYMQEIHTLAHETKMPKRDHTSKWTSIWLGITSCRQTVPSVRHTICLITHKLTGTYIIIQKEHGHLKIPKDQVVEIYFLSEVIFHKKHAWWMNHFIWQVVCTFDMRSNNTSQQRHILSFCKYAP